MSDSANHVAAISSAEADAEKHSVFPWRWFALTLGLVLLRALPNLRYPMGRDQATAAVMAQRMLEGLSLYRDLWDNRPPGNFLFYTPFVKLLGHVMWVSALADILVVLALSCLLFRFAHRHLGAPAAVIGTLAAVSFHCSGGYTHAAQPDILLMVFVLAALALLGPVAPASSIRAFGAGGLLAAAFWVKYNALAFVPFVAIAPVLDWSVFDSVHHRLALRISWRDFIRQIAFLGGGFASLLVAGLAWFWVTGTWAAFREVQIEVLLRYGSSGFSHHPSAFWSLGELNRHMGLWNHAIVVVALIVAWKRTELGRLAPVLFGYFAGLAAILLPGRIHNYYIEIIFPFLGLIWGYVVVEILRGFRLIEQYLNWRNFRLARVALWVALANIVFALLLTDALNLTRDARGLAAWVRDPQESYSNYFPENGLDKFEDQLKVIDFVRAHSTVNDTVYVWGTQPLINFLSERHSPGRFVSNLPLVASWGPERWRAELVRDLQVAPPLFVVVARHDAVPSITDELRDSEQFLATFPSLEEFISSRYERAMRLRGFDIYRRK